MPISNLTRKLSKPIVLNRNNTNISIQFMMLIEKCRSKVAFSAMDIMNRIMAGTLAPNFLFKRFKSSTFPSRRKWLSKTRGTLPLCVSYTTWSNCKTSIIFSDRLSWTLTTSPTCKISKKTSFRTLKNFKWTFLRLISPKNDSKSKKKLNRKRLSFSN